MIIFKQSFLKPHIYVLLCMVMIHYHAQAFSISDQFGHVQNYIVQNPKTFIIGAMAMGIGGFLWAHECAKAEELRLQSAHKEKEARMKELPLDDFLEEFVHPHIQAVEILCKKDVVSELCTLYTQLKEMPLLESERTSIKTRIKDLYLENANQISIKCAEYSLHAATEHMEQRIALMSDGASAFENLFEQIKTLRAQLDTLDQFSHGNGEKLLKKKRR